MAREHHMSQKLRFGILGAALAEALALLFYFGMVWAHHASMDSDSPLYGWGPLLEKAELILLPFVMLGQVLAAMGLYEPENVLGFLIVAYMIPAALIGFVIGWSIGKRSESAG